MKKFYLLTKTLLVMALLCVGASNVWATSVYERGYSTAWSASDVSESEWVTTIGANDSYTTTSGLALTKYQGGLTHACRLTKTISTTAGVVLQLNAVWNPGDATGTNKGSNITSTYFQFADIICRLKGSDGIASVSIGGSETTLATSTALRNKVWTIYMLINQLTGLVTYRITINGTTYTGTGTSSTASGSFTSLTIGHGGQTGSTWNNTTTLTSVQVQEPSVTAITSSSLPYASSFSTGTAPFYGGAYNISGNGNNGANAPTGLFQVNNATAVAYFDTSSPTGKYTLGSTEALTISFTAYHGWYSSGKSTVSVVNSEGVVLAGYTYDLNACEVTDVTIGGETVATSGVGGRSVGGANCNGLNCGTETRNYITTSGKNPVVTMTFHGDGTVEFGMNGGTASNYTYSTTLSDITMDLAQMNINDNCSSSDRSVCISDLSVSSVNIYDYTVNALEKGNTSNVLTEFASGKVTSSSPTINVNIPWYVLSGTTLYYQNGTNNVSQDITSDEQAIDIEYTAQSVTDCVFYVEGENIANARQITLTQASNYSGGCNFDNQVFTTLEPGKYVIQALFHSGNGSDNTKVQTTATFKAGSTSIGTKDVYCRTNSQSFTSDNFNLYSSTDLSITLASNNATGVDYIYVRKIADAVLDAVIDCETYETSSTFKTYIEGLYDAGSLTTAAEVYAAHTAWQVAQADAASSNDITKVIFDAQVSSNTRWNSARTRYNEQYSGAPDNTYFDAWNTEASNARQTIYGLPAGTYTIKVATRSSAGVTDKSKYNVWVSGGTADVSLLGSHIGNRGGNLGNGWNWTYLSFTLDAKADVTIGFYACPTSSLWAGCDDWHLYKGTLETSVSASVSASKYATFVSPYSLDFTSTSIKAHTAVVNTETGVVTLTETNQIPSNTPVVLYYEGGAKDEDIPVIASADAVGDNNLFAGAGEAVATGTNPYNYVLDNGEGIGFYKANNVTVATNRAYLQTTYNVAASSSARGMRMVFAGDITGISEAAATAEAAQKDGKFIENGKLVIVKNGKKYNANGALIY